MEYRVRDAHSRDFRDMASLVLSIIGVPEADRNYDSVMQEFIQRTGIGTVYVVLEDSREEMIVGLAGITARGSFAQLLGPLVLQDIPESSIRELIQYVESKAREMGVSRVASQLPSENAVITHLEQEGFERTKTIVEHWQGIPRFIEPPSRDDIIIQPISKEDTKQVYKLIKKSMNLEAGLYLSLPAFETMALQSKERDHEAWVVAKNHKDEIEGFSASFKINSPFIQGEKDVIIYGPKTKEKEVMALLLTEIVNYWKLKGIKRFVIVREKTDTEEALFLQSLGFKRGLEVLNVEKKIK